MGILGSGKSGLINSLFRFNEAKESYYPTPTSNKVKTYKNPVDTVLEGSVKATIDATIWETPGMCDRTLSDADVVNKTAANCERADLIVYCMNMHKRFDKADGDAIKEITHKLGEDVWKRVILLSHLAMKSTLTKMSSRESVNHGRSC